MRRHSIVNKILIYYLSSITIVFILISFLISYSFKRYFLNDVIKGLDSQGEIIKNFTLNYMNDSGNENRKYLSDYINYVSEALDIDLILSDGLYYVYLVSNNIHKNLLGKQLKNYDELIKSTFYNVYDKDLQLKVYKFVKPLYDANIYKGSITLILDENYINVKMRRVNIIISFLFLSIIFILFVIYYFISKRILVRPIKIINNTAKKFALGEVNNRVPIHTNDEIGELSNSFNYMADSLEKIDSNRREFLSNVSHELRTPLTTIIGFLSGILDGIIPFENHIEKLTIVYGEVRRLSRLVNDLLDLTAIESGKFTLRPQIIELNSLIRYTVKNFEQEIKQNNILMEVYFEENTIQVVADEDRLVQVLNNLIANAIKYCDDKKRISISTKIKNNKAFVSIFNTSKLLSEEEFNNIWIRFYKNDKSRTGKESTGLGLSIVRGIISQFKEDIWVENRVKEEGVSFIFTLKLSN